MNALYLVLMMLAGTVVASSKNPFLCALEDQAGPAEDSVDSVTRKKPYLKIIIPSRPALPVRSILPRNPFSIELDEAGPAEDEVTVPPRHRRHIPALARRVVVGQPPFLLIVQEVVENEKPCQESLYTIVRSEKYVLRQMPYAEALAALKERATVSRK